MTCHLSVICLATILIAVTALSAQARDIHVSTRGLASGKGTATEPFSRIEDALRQASPGDTVRVAAGLYVGRVVVPVSGEEDRPIVVRGERGKDGEWLTIIDSSSPLDVKWVSAPEIGEGVYKTPFPGYEPKQILVDGKFIPRIWDGKMTDASGFAALRFPPGFEALAFPPDHVVKTRYYEQEVQYWDIMGAMVGNHDGWTYIRFRDRDDPNQKSLRAAPEGGGVHIEDQKHIVLSDLLIRGGENCVQITGSEAAHNVVERCRLLNGAKRVYISEGASHTLVCNNEMTMDFYGETCQTGGW